MTKHSFQICYYKGKHQHEAKRLLLEYAAALMTAVDANRARGYLFAVPSDQLAQLNRF